MLFSGGYLEINAIAGGDFGFFQSYKPGMCNDIDKWGFGYSKISAAFDRFSSGFTVNYNKSGSGFFCGLTATERATSLPCDAPQRNSVPSDLIC